jgi:hypothetical protein
VAWDEMKRLVYIAILLLSASSAFAKEPDCAGPDNWAAVQVFTSMKNAGLIKNDQLDFRRTKVRRISSERIGRDLWRQVLFVQYYRNDGSPVEAIAVSDASQEECSMGDVQVYLVSRKLGP